MPRSPSPAPISKVPRILNSLPPHRSARGPVKRMPPTSPAKVTALIRPSCSPLSPALPPRSTLRVVRFHGQRNVPAGIGIAARESGEVLFDGVYAWREAPPPHLGQV